MTVNVVSMYELNSINALSSRGDFWPPICRLFGYGTVDWIAFQLALRIYDDSCVILEIDPGTVDSPVNFTLADDHCWRHLSAELGFPVAANGDENDIANGSGRVSVEMTLPVADADELQWFGARVIGAVEDGADWQARYDLVPAA